MCIRLYIHLTYPGGMMGYPPSLPFSHHGRETSVLHVPSPTMAGRLSVLHVGTMGGRHVCASGPSHTGREAHCLRRVPTHYTQGERHTVCAEATHHPWERGTLSAQRLHPPTMGERHTVCAEAPNPPWEGGTLSAQRLLTMGGRHPLCAEAPSLLRWVHPGYTSLLS